MIFCLCRSLDLSSDPELVRQQERPGETAPDRSADRRSERERLERPRLCLRQAAPLPRAEPRADSERVAERFRIAHDSSLPSCQAPQAGHAVESRGSESDLPAKAPLQPATETASEGCHSLPPLLQEVQGKDSSEPPLETVPHLVIRGDAAAPAAEAENVGVAELPPAPWGWSDRFDASRKSESLKPPARSPGAPTREP